jgi:hypothetical protein
MSWKEWTSLVEGTRELVSRADAEFEVDVAQAVLDGLRAEKYGFDPATLADLRMVVVAGPRITATMLPTSTATRPDGAWTSAHRPQRPSRPRSPSFCHST